MSFAIGLALVAVTVVMVALARPNKAGEPALFLRVWAVGQAYVLGAMTSAVVGITLMLSEWLS
jgi:hypothetical protein